MRNLHRHAYALAQCWMQVNRFADIHLDFPHFYRQGDLVDHVARMRAEHDVTQDLAVAPASMAALSMCHTVVAVKGEVGSFGVGRCAISAICPACPGGGSRVGPSPLCA